MNVKFVNGDRCAILRIVLIYAVLGGLWIYLSDSMLGLLVDNPRSVTVIATYKGLLFIALTSLLLYFLISRYVTNINEKAGQLKKSEDRFQSIFNGISEAVFIHDAASGDIISVNRTACEMFGYSAEEIMAMDVGNLSLNEPPYTQNEALVWLKGADQGVPQQFEWQCRRKDGNIFWVEVSMRAATIGDEFCIIVSVRDISERKRFMEEFIAIIQTTKDGFNITDIHGHLLEVNRSYCEMVGYSRDELLRMSIPDLEANEQPAEVAEHIKSMIAKGSDHFESRHRRKDGMAIDIQVSTTFLQKHGGRFYSFVRDTTASRQAEELLKQSDALLKNLSMQIPGVLFQTVVTPEGHVSTPYASEKLHDIYELSPDDICDDLALLISRFHPDDRERILASIDDATIALDRWECEYRVLLPRQGLKWLYGTAHPQRRDDGSIVMYGIIMDITERKRAEELLRLSEEKFSTAFRASPDAVNLTRLSDSTYLEVNEGFTHITGYLPEEVIGRSALELNIWVDPRDRVKLVQELEKHGVVRNLEAEFRRKDGTTLTGHMSACRIEIGGEQLLLSITRDITDRIKSENELLKMQKLESLGVLAGGIAHDFNNILTGIVGNISFARMFIDPSHRSAPILLEAEKATQRATDLAHQLLTFAKGGQPIKKAASAQQIVTASASFVLRGSNVQSVITASDDLYVIEVDEGQINQAFNNIIINAAQSMPSGGTISIIAENITVESSNSATLPAGNYVKFTFTDTGCGMSDETLKRIFDPYFTTKAGGNGLGLASVYSIVTKHGGQISVHSEMGRGTVFEILLPASSHQIPKNSGGAETLIAKGHEGKSLLVMDDEKMIRELASEMFRELGYQISTCANGDEAIELYKSAQLSGAPFWAVIMDLTIPGGKGGKDAAREILAFDPCARLIVSSGYSNDPVMANFALHGFCAAVVKPYTFSELTKVMTELQ